MGTIYFIEVKTEVFRKSLKENIFLELYKPASSELSNLSLKYFPD